MRIKQDAKEALLPRISSTSPTKMQSTWTANKPSPLISPRKAGGLAAQTTKLRPLKKATWRRNKLTSKSLHLQMARGGTITLKKQEYLRLMRDSPELLRHINNRSLQPTYDPSALDEEEDQEFE